jgi:hypothetical protein
MTDTASVREQAIMASTLYSVPLLLKVDSGWEI